MVAALEAIGLTKQYRRGTLALSNVSVEVAPGSITALVGPNAAGKSTLIRTWVGFERPTDGSVRVSGIDPSREPAAALRHVGYVPQQPALYRELTTADHLALAAHLRPTFDRAVAERHLEYLAIPLRARATTLSGGQQAQVMLAVALGTRADVLLLDEPLASLDPLARSEFLTVLRTAVRENGSTALLSSHIVTDVEQVCDRLIVLGIGHVLLDEGLADAVAGHSVRVGDGGPTAGGTAGAPPHEAGDATVVGRFPTDAGQLLTLVRVRPGVPIDGDLRPATLDEVVKGYLSAGRRPRSEAA